MKIENIGPTSPIPGEQGRTGGPARPQSAPSAGTQGLGAGALNQAAQDPSQDIDPARVEEIRQAIREGRLALRADNIADGLIASVKSLLDGKSS